MRIFNKTWGCTVGRVVHKSGGRERQGTFSTSSYQSYQDPNRRNSFDNRNVTNVTPQSQFTTIASSTSSLVNDRFKLLAQKQKEHRERITERISENREPIELVVKHQLEKELELYWNIPAHTECPLAFWMSPKNYLPLLSKIAFSILTTPASSGAAEREFSKAGWLCNNRRNRLEKGLPIEVLLSCNKDMLRNRLDL